MSLINYTCVFTQTTLVADGRIAEQIPNVYLKLNSFYANPFKQGSQNE